MALNRTVDDHDKVLAAAPRSPITYQTASVGAWIVALRGAWVMGRWFRERTLLIQNSLIHLLPNASGVSCCRASTAETHLPKPLLSRGGCKSRR